MDGLQVTEKTGLSFQSTNGAMHACGHDTHMAMLLGAAKILWEIRDHLSGTVRLIFQPAEELSRGSRWMIEEGCLEGVDAIYGAHVWGALEAGKIDVSPGNRMAACHIFKIDIEGVTAHGSTPHLGVDALMLGANILQSFNQIVARENDVLNPLVISVGTFQGGTRLNTIANHCEMEGTVRTFAHGTKAEDDMRSVIEHVSAAFGGTGKMDYEYLDPPLINADEKLNRLAHDAVEKLYGADSVGKLPAIMAGEDFSWYGEKGIPSIFALIGSKNQEHPHTNHSEYYDVPEWILARGTGVMVQVAVDYLNT